MNTESNARPQPNDQVQGLVWGDAVVPNRSGQSTATSSMPLPLARDAYAITYFAFAVCATVSYLECLVDRCVRSSDGLVRRALVLFTMGSPSRPMVEPFTVDAGCHQILVKAGAQAGTLQTVTVTPNSATAPMAWALSLPPVLPSTANPIANGVPLTQFLVLQNTIAPGARMPRFHSTRPTCRNNLRRTVTSQSPPRRTQSRWIW